MLDNRARMASLVEILAKAAEVYEQGEDEIMSNFDYDRLYDELLKLEAETGIILAGSVTQKAGYDVQSKLPKITHKTKMLSLDKTKDAEILGEILGDKEGILSWKEDGLTVVGTLDDGKIESAVTRGNGTVGEDITNNFKNFINIPLTVPTHDRIVLRGEALISYANFEELNSKIADIENKYKNPRNLCSGSVRQLDPNETKKRNVEFVVFEVIEGFEEFNLKSERLEEARKLGFEIVDYVKVTKETLGEAIEEFKSKIATYKYPTDGLVLTIDDIEYSLSLGTTSKFPKDSKAFKWADEQKQTVLKEIFWSNSRTGAINPVAVFEPVDLEGTEVKRASVHNISIIEGLELGIGDTITVVKANMIIPQVVDNLTRSNNLVIPAECPVCGGPTTIEQSKSAKVLYCRNEDCLAKKIGLLNHFTSRDAMNIEGLSEATLERFVQEGVLHSYKDIYHLEQHRDKLTKLEGFGVKSYENILKAVENSRDVDLPNFLYSLGVEQLGRTSSRLVCRAYDNDLERIINAAEEDLMGIDGIGNISAREIRKYFEKNADAVRELAKEMKFKEAVKVDTSSSIAGMIFVVTGDVNHFANRKELQAKIESLGGKVSGSVSKNTNYLINNDNTSGSGKNKKAKELSVPIITENEFLELIK